MSTLTCHLVTRDPDAAASWYGSVLGGVEISRITLPSGQIRDVPHDEVVRLAAAAFAGASD